MNDSEFLKLCLARRSVRKFLDRPVEREKIERCLEAARVAPSADNFQPWRFLVFDDPAQKRALADAVFTGAYAYTRPLAKAPVIVCLVIKESLAVNKLAAAVLGTKLQFVDAGIAGEHFVLAAAEQELGTCWVGWFNARALVKHLGLKGAYKPVCLIALGYPAADQGPRPPRRKAPAEVAFWNSPPR